LRGYKQGSLSRRILKRMQAVGIEDFQRYTEVLEANPGEFAELFNTILINVTSLARDREAWDVLAKSIIPAIVDGKPPGAGPWSLLGAAWTPPAGSARAAPAGTGRSPGRRLAPSCPSP
jgi:chemotaxis methyl-accepting protein methylase